MAGVISKASDKEYLAAWREFKDSFSKSTTVDLSETPAQKRRRIAKLEKNPEEWFKYYFPNYCSAPPADFHLRATKRLLSNPEWFEVRAWSRELAKSARAMMEITYLAMTGAVHNVLLVSNSNDNATLLLLPFKACFESNARIINDYGDQRTIGGWKEDKFTIKKGCSFRAFGWGQSPRGTRKDNVRPDFILIDDIDTDEECRNEDIMKAKINWIEQALFPTRSISTPTRILANGNIIHDNCAVNALGRHADKFEIINIRDKDGKSTWLAKNTEEMIDRVLATISYESAQKEYYNNPMDGSDTFRDPRWGKVPRLDSCSICIYADPATSNKDVTSGSYKAVGVIAQKDLAYYIVKVWLDTMSNAHFVDALFSAYLYVTRYASENIRIYIENNTLQNPFFEQVLQPQIFQKSRQSGTYLPITPDDRDKGEKYTRIEGTLEPLHRAGLLIFNIAEKDDPHMQRLEAQFKSFSRKQKRKDGPDMVEGGVYKLQQQIQAQSSDGIISIPRNNLHRM